MEPLAAAGYVMIASAAVLALGLGAVAGAIAAAFRSRVLWPGLLGAGVYFCVTVLMD